MRRGEIYLIRRRDTVGSEIAKARPGVIVSNDALNDTSGVIEVVYLTTKPKKDLPTHAPMQSTGVESTALCEQIDSVSIELVGSYCGTCTDEEMAAIERGLRTSLGLEERPAPVKVSAHEIELAKLIAERDTYKALVDQMLRQGVCGV